MISIEYFKRLILSTILCLSLPACFSESAKAVNSGSGALASDTASGLKDHYRNFFPIGVSVSPSSLNGPDAKLILKHFSSLTAENVMKMGPIHPEEGRFFWDNADKIVNFAQEHGLLVRGHTLCWHQQTPAWMFRDGSGNPVTKEVLLARLKDHIMQVVKRYKGKVYAWDVVNEAVDDSESKGLRESEWYKICGEEFIAKAFQWAHEADPDAQLFYNDYNTEFPAKRDKIYQLLKGLLDNGVPINGIGLQGHWSLKNPSEKNLREAIEKFSSLGLKIQITELDVSVYSSNEKTAENQVFTQEKEQLQMDQYKMIFRIFREYRKEITGVTFWNISDRSSWLDNFPVRGRKNYPLLFDQNLQPKKAYREVIDF
jgi:endo-1,4-beta-xylanase